MELAGDELGELPGTGRMPVLFVGHGSPINLVLMNDFTRHLLKLGKEIPKPKAIMVVSAHWLTDGSYVTCMKKPRTIYDFYGFPDQLYGISYPSPGAPRYARLAANSVKAAKGSCDTGWGLDHASWSILHHMYPKADIPVFEMSLDYSFNDWHPKPMQYHHDLAKELVALREKGVLIIGSGNIVHNLQLVDFQKIDATPYDWATEFDEEVRSALLSGSIRELINYQNLSRKAYLAVPTLDHYLPMIYAVALQQQGETLRFTYEGFQNGSISMRCFRIG
ncbi:MAG: 4,5-DOPA dioxygenase extradiol [Promethearchaeati archaeon SRVP18_Atabeyarchaeia-1]